MKKLYINYVRRTNIRESDLKIVQKLRKFSMIINEMVKTMQKIELTI